MPIHMAAVCSILGLRYRCTVTDYTFRKEDVQDDGKDKKAKESEEDRCKRLQKWKSAYNADNSKDKKGEATKAQFWAMLGEEHSNFGR